MRFLTHKRDKALYAKDFSSFMKDKILNAVKVKISKEYYNDTLKNFVS